MNPGTAHDPPALPHPMLPRQRLREAVLSTAPASCCIVAAPRGYGATTAVADALAGLGGDRVAWVRIAGGGEEGQTRLLVREAADRIAAAAVAAGAMSSWLVVDGLPRHYRTIWDELGDLVRRMPSSVRLAVTTPHRPPPEWAAHAAWNGSVHLDAAALAFTADEAVLLLQAFSPATGVETLSAVLEQAEGWALALVAAGACARLGRLDEGWLPSAGAAQLFASWLSALPVATREMLLASSVLDLLSPQVVESVTGDAGSAQRLEELHDRLGHLAEIAPPPGHGGRWWRRHPLLTAALRQQALHDRRQRHSLAADWYAGRGDVHRTIHHLVQAGRSGEAGDFLMQHHRQLFEDGRASELVELCRLIPGPTGVGAQRQLLLLGWGQVLSGYHAQASQTLQTLQERVRSSAGEPAVEYPQDDPALGSWELLAAQADLLRAFLAGYRADPATMVEFAGRAVEVLRHHPPTESAQTAWTTLLQGLIWSAQIDTAREQLHRIAEVPFPNDAIREGTLVPLQAMQLAIDGDIRRASALVSRTRTWIRQHGMDPWSTPHFSALAAEAAVACETGDPQHAAELAGRIIERSQQQQSYSSAVAALTLRARCWWAVGDYQAARQDLRAGRETALATCPDSAMVAALDLAEATLHMATGAQVGAQVSALPPGVYSDLSKAAARLSTQPADAARMLEGLHPQVPRARCVRHLLLASALLGSSRQLAQRHLRQAAAIAHEHGMALLLVEASPVIVQLAVETAAEARDDDALAWALAQRARYAANEHPDPAQRQVRALPPLSRGELQLIALLPSRASNAELAAMLGVSVNTVKTRLRRLYGKLEAGGRDEAIAKAQQRGLIG